MGVSKTYLYNGILYPYTGVFYQFGIKQTAVATRFLRKYGGLFLVEHRGFEPLRNFF